MSERAASGLGSCTWCDEPAVDQLIVESGRKHRKLAPVCAAHAKHYEERGMETVGSEIERKVQAQIKRSQWKRSNQWR